MNYTELKKITVRTSCSKKLKNNLSKKIKSALMNESNKATPMVRASYTWSIISEQLEDILGTEVHTQWFKSINPLFITNSVLVLETKDNFSSFWINKNYQELIDLLVSFQDKSLTSFFVAPVSSSNELENTASEIHSQPKYQYS